MRSPRPTVKMRIGHLLELNQPRELAPSVALRQLRNQASAAVRAGFDGVWCGEHHAIGDHSFHPLQVLSIVASDNPSMTVGTSAILMPLHTVGEVGTALGTLAALAEEVILGLGLGYRPSELALFGLRLPGGRARLLVVADDAALQARFASQRPPLWRDLDTAVLHEVVLPALDAGSVAYRAEVDDAGAELEANGQGALFVLRPVDVATVFACASAGTPMPAKTTMFHPKPRAGLVLRSLDSG